MRKWSQNFLLIFFVVTKWQETTKLDVNHIFHNVSKFAVLVSLFLKTENCT